LHGYLGTEAACASLAGRLQDAGFVRVFTLGYDTRSSGVPESAAWLVDATKTVMATTGSPHVHLVGHSLGGLVARYAVQCLGLDAVVCGVVTVGTPHQGTRLARLGPGRSAAALRPGSPLLRRLPPLEETGGVRWAVVRAGADIVVTGPCADGELSVRGYGHHSVLHSVELADTVVEHLLAAEGMLAARREN
jgi:pimeloyl-ACP methyl ester carboxylesterase